MVGNEELNAGRPQVSETTSLLSSPDIDPEQGEASNSDTMEAGWDGYRDFDGLPRWRRPTVFWLMFPFCIFTLAFGGIIVPRLNLILGLVCERYFAEQEINDPNFTASPILLDSDNPQCRIPEVQKNVTQFMLVLSLVTGILSALVAPKLGQLSDRYGRMKLMALASVGGILNEAITIVTAKFPETVDYRWLILGSIFDGLTGSFSAGAILGQAYASDCTAPSNRAVSIGLLHACLFGGLAIGPLLAGYMVKWTGSLLSIFYIALGCHTFFMLFAAFIIPESLSKRKQLLARKKHQQARESLKHTVHIPSSWWHSLRANNPLEPFSRLWPQGHGTSRQLRVNLVIMAFIDCILMGSTMGAGPVIMLYAGYTFGWDTFETSQFISSASMVRVLVLLGISPVMNYVFRTLPARRKQRLTGVAVTDKTSGADVLDLWIFRTALLSDVSGAVAYFFAKSGAVFFFGGMITAVGGLGSATIQAMITKHVPDERVGEMFGTLGMIHALSRVVFPILFNGVYAATVENVPQTIFAVLASLLALSLLSSFGIRPHVFWAEDSPRPHRHSDVDNSLWENENLLAEEQALAAVKP